MVSISCFCCYHFLQFKSECSGFLLEISELEVTEIYSINRINKELLTEGGKLNLGDWSVFFVRKYFNLAIFWFSSLS